jgi:Transposase DNA-binding
MEVWVERELQGCEFSDQRLKLRLGKVLDKLGQTIGATLPTACQDWAATNEAYRFFSNPRVNESIILAGHFAATKARIASSKGPILVLHDTTEFSFKRDKPDSIGKTTVLASRPHRNPTTLCGLLMHSSLAITPQGKPLGLTAFKFWTRKQFKGTNALKKKINPTRIPIDQKESVRWL